MVQGKITDNPVGRHSMQINQWPASIIPHFYTGCRPCDNPPDLLYPGLWHAPNMLAGIPSGLVLINININFSMVMILNFFSVNDGSRNDISEM